MNYPELIITDKPLHDVLDEIFNGNTLLVTDPYNYSLSEKYDNTILVNNNCYLLSYEEIKNIKFDKVVAVGGCSALDVGRACAEGLKFIAIPTILSTSCISVNISILRAKDKTTKLKTVIPDKTIVSIPELLKTDKKELKKWSSSGFGDLFANISASIDFEYKNNSFSFGNISKNASEAFLALDYVINSFEDYNASVLRNLAIYLHNSSLDVIKRGNNELSAGCEHAFYETIIREEKYSNQIQTHGILVSIGTLITSAIYERTYNEKSITEKLKMAYEKLGLPVNYKDLSELGIEKEHIINTLEKLKEQYSITGDYFKYNDYSLLDELF